MASIQLPPNVPKPLVSKWPLCRVQIRRKWKAADGDPAGIDVWQTAHYFEVMSIDESAAPTIPTAVLKYRAGRIRREDGGAGIDPSLLDDSGFSTEQAQNLLNWFVRIQYLTLALPGSQKTNATTLFVGQIVDYATAHGGDTLADQTFTAYGIEHLFEKVIIAGSYIPTPGQTYATRIDRGLIFNQRYTLGPSQLGNRSLTKAARHAGSSLQAYMFDHGDSDDPDGCVWSAMDIVEYLVNMYTPEDFTFSIGGVADDVKNNGGAVISRGALTGFTPPKVTLDGFTLYQALNRLIDRRRGMGWRLKFSDLLDDGSDIRFELFVFTVFEQAITSADGQIIPGNSDHRSLDQTDPIVDVLIEELTTNIDSLNAVGTIIVEGEEILSCFTLSVSDGTLVKGWSDAEEAQYLNGAGEAGTDATSKKKNDFARKSESLARVFTTFKVPPNWSWKAGPGDPWPDGSSRGAPYNVNPSIDNAGGVHPETPAPIRPWGLRFEHHLPLLRPTDDDDTRNSIEYEQPFALLKYTFPGTPPTTKYIFAHDPGSAGLAGCHLSGLANELGIELRFSPAHRLAKNHWDGAKSSDVSSPPYDWKDLIATMAVRTDTKLSVRDTIPGRDPWRELRIRVPGAQLWRVAERTVIDLDDQANLVRMQAGWEKDLIVRDDGPHLRRILAMAKAWYRKTRRAMTFTTKDFQLQFPVGSYFTQIIKSDGTLDVNSVVSRRKLDFTTGTVTAVTSFGEIDFVGMREDLPALET